MNDPVHLRLDFILRSYIQQNEDIEVILEDPIQPIFTETIHWNFTVNYSNHLVLGIFVHTYREPNEEIKANVSKFAESAARKIVESDEQLKRFAEGVERPNIRPEEREFNKLLRQIDQAMEEYRNNRIVGFWSLTNPYAPIYPQFTQIDETTKVKFVTLNRLMLIEGTLPDVESIKHPVIYQKLDPNVLSWLEKAGIPVRSEYAPLLADWMGLFEGGLRLPDNCNIQRFFAHLIHCLLIEVQLMVNRRIYSKLGFNVLDFPLTLWKEVLSEDELKAMRVESLHNPNFLEMHSRIFVEYYAIMVRALWDKIMVLACIAFGVNPNFDKITEALDMLAKVEYSLPVSRHYINIFLDIARLRLGTDGKKGWIREFRDSLLHKTGQHSSGVLAQAKSWDSTQQLWMKITEEHNWLTEGILALMASLLLAGWSQPKRE